MKLWRVYGVTVGTEHEFESPLLPAPAGSRIDVRFEFTTDPVPYKLDSSGTELGGVRVPDVVDFRLFEDRIVAHVPAGEPDGMAEIHFLSSAMTTWLEYRGVLALHASAVVIDGTAVAFMATSRGGKSGLAAALVREGCPLLTDDILALSVDTERESGQSGFDTELEPTSSDFTSGVQADPGYPQMRMWPDAAEYFVGEAWRHLPFVHRDYRKLRVPIGTGLLGEFHADSAKLGAILVPNRLDDSVPSEDHGDGPFGFERLGPTAAILELTQNTFSPRAIEDRGLQPLRLARLAKLVERVPVFRFRYPSGYSHLPDAAAAVVSRLESTRP